MAELTLFKLLLMALHDTGSGFAQLACCCTCLEWKHGGPCACGLHTWSVDVRNLGSLSHPERLFRLQDANSDAGSDVGSDVEEGEMSE